MGGGRGYDEATRRAKRKKRTEETAQARYVERRKRMWGGGIKRGIEVGPLTVERVVGARYEWRDEAYAARSGASAVIWLGSQVWDPQADRGGGEAEGRASRGGRRRGRRHGRQRRCGR